MGLRGVHIVFISVSTLLALVLGTYCLRQWWDAGSSGALAGAVASAVAALVLVAYGRWFLRKMRLVLVALALAGLSGGLPATACEVCYGQADSPMIDGARLGVFALLAVVLAVQACFIAFFICLRRRARRLAAATTATGRPIPTW